MACSLWRGRRPRAISWKPRGAPPRHPGPSQRLRELVRSETSLKEKLQEARSQATVAGQYQGWSTERASLLEKIEALEAARDVALTRASQAEAKAAEVVTRAAGCGGAGQGRRSRIRRSCARA